ncbi:MAG TPA: recombinase family protein [Chloroflexota bacterium]|nr:recombinase family protein [Chloroflexota bacterium]
MHPHDNAARTSSRCLAVVARVSTEEQERYGTSLEEQAAKGEQYAQLRDMVVADSAAYQGDESGTLPLHARPIMQRILADARARKFDAVVFRRLDRVARRTKYILEVWDALEDAGVAVHVIEPPIDTSTPEGRLIRNVLASAAEFERDLFMVRAASGRRGQVAAGAIYAPRGKYGYEYVKRDRGRGITPHVVLQSEQAEVVRRIYRLRGRGMSYERIALVLTAEGVPPPSVALHHKQRATRWHFKTIANIVTDCAYMGEGCWDRTTHVRDRQGKRRRVLAPAERTPLPVRYPPLVTREEWHAAQADHGSRPSCPVRATADEYLFYGGMARCVEHDKSMSGSLDKAGVRRYRCCRTVDSGKRTTHGVRALDLEERVWDKVMEAMLDTDRMIAAAEALAREAEAGMEDVARERAEVMSALERLADERRTFFTVMRKAGARAEDIAEQVRLMGEEESALRARLERTAAQMALHQAGLPRAEAIREMCERFVEQAQGATRQTKRALLEALEAVVLVQGNRFRFEGVLGDLGVWGELPVHASTSAG